MSKEFSSRRIEKPETSLVLANVGFAWVGDHADRRLVSGVDLVLRHGRIDEITVAAMRPTDARVIDASSWLVLPGLINAHHHLSQQLTRNLVPSASVVQWLAECYPRWSRLSADTALAGARVGLAELLLAGVTTTADLSYYFPRGHADIFDAQVQAAADVGIRMLAVRGGMRSVGGPVRDLIGSSIDSTVESAETLLTELDRVTAAYHDHSPDAMLKVGVGLTEPLWDEPDLMRSLSGFARHHDLALHTHVHPRQIDREVTGGVADAFAEVGWWHDRLWVAHGTQLSELELIAMSEAGVALATCPSSNARLGMQIAPAWDLHLRGGTVAIGVDGAASSDSGDMVGETRLAWQVQRIRAGVHPEANALTPELALSWATNGGAVALGWPGLGELTVGGLADVACFDISRLDYVGSSSPLDALLLCGLSHRASLVVVAGRIVVEDGRLTLLDESELADSGRRAAALLSPSKS
ncbi:amidohydrolase family protein [Salinibacterium sp. TMP30]|uniref:amidohydrolase family protein n=1 Tax=Salinibacterium sp. TMP30 TaxID=3138237 RepID=UPI003139E3D7